MKKKYRLAMVILFSVFVTGVILLGARFVENGRYVQYDHQKDHVVVPVRENCGFRELGTVVAAQSGVPGRAMVNRE